MNLIRSSLFILAMFFITLACFSILVLDKIFCLIRRKPHTTDRGHKVATLWGKSLLQIVPGWKIILEGKENIPHSSEKPFIITANHESATDILALYYLNIQFRWLAKIEAFKIPVVGTAMRWAGYIPIIRGKKESHTKALNKCRELLQNKTPVLFFPEGTRSTIGKPKKFKVGAFLLAKECQVPVVPIVLFGAGKLLRKHSISPKAATVHIKILPAQNIKESESVDEFCKRVESLIVSEHEKIAQINN